MSKSIEEIIEEFMFGEHLKIPIELSDQSTAKLQRMAKILRHMLADVKGELQRRKEH